MEYGLIGEKLGHSFSKVIHESIMAYKYDLVELDENEFDIFMKARDFKAINVTIPYKRAVIDYLDEIDDNVQRIGTCNVVVNRNGKLYGYNSDYYGLKELIRVNGIDIREKKCLILGSGGTSSTAYYVLKDMGAKDIQTVSRNKKEGVITYDEALKLQDTQIIVNTTPKGMYPSNDEQCIDIAGFDSLEGIVDVIFNPLRTNFILQGQKKGLKTAGGLYMLVAQAVKAIEYFKDIELDKKLVDGIYQKILREKENIVLIGMPGCGKSTIAEKLDSEYIDTDRLIEEKFGRKPGEIIEEEGEKAFRDKETEVIGELSKFNGKVIATGGGAVLREENVNMLKQNGKLVYLQRDLEKLQTGNGRPLSKDFDSLKKLYEKRKDIYLGAADICIDNNGTADECLRRINENICD
ncbi:MAG: shikimate kinase [Erysipelotrichaceae bacterium]